MPQSSIPPAALVLFGVSLKEAFEEKVTTKVNGRVRSITKKEMALRRLVHGAAKGEPKPFNLLLKYDPVLPDIESESRSNAKPFLGLKYIVIPDNRREPDVTERLLKVRAEARAKYYSRMRKD